MFIDAQERANHYGISVDLYRSIIGFNGGKNADRATVQSFLISYLTPPPIKTVKALRKQVRFRPDIREELSLKSDNINKLIIDLINEEEPQVSTV